MTLKMPADRDRRPGGGPRGKVRYFSAASRLRMIRKIHTVHRQASLPCFVTLTFPDLFPTFEDARRALDTLFKRWKRRWPGVSVLWRIEAKARQSGSQAGNVAPHFHMLVWGADFDGDKARLDWFEVCKSDEYAHWRHGYDGAMQLESWEKAAAYCAEYCAKKSNAEAPGRQWGMHNRKAFPRDEEPIRVRLSWREAWTLRRTIRKAVAAKIGRKVKCAQSLYTSDPVSLLRFLALLRGKRPAKDDPQQTSRVQQWRAFFRPWQIQTTSGR